MVAIPNDPKSTFWQYVVATASVAGGLALRLALKDVLGSSGPYLTLFPAVMFAAWFGGLSPAIFATILSVGAATLVIAQGTPVDLVRGFMFVTFSILISALFDALRNSRRSAEQGHDLLQTTLASIGDAVIATDASGLVTFLNSVAEGLTGWTQAEAKGRPIAGVFVILNESFEDLVGKAIRERKAFSLTGPTLLINKSGRHIPIEESVAPILDSRQNLFGVIVVFRDVTARSQTENRLRENEQRLKLALDAGKIGAWDWTVADNRIEWSDHVYTIHRLDRTAFSGRLEDWVLCIYPGDRERVQKSIDESLRHDVPYEITFRIVRPTGELRWVCGMGRVFRNEKGEPVRMLGAITDVTVQRRAEAYIEQQWSTFDTALSNTPDHHFILDLDGRYTYANRSVLTLLQVPLEDLVGKNFFELDYPPELAARLLRQAQDVILTRQPVRDQTPFTGANGESGTYEYILVPVFGADNQVEAVAGSSRNITGLMRAEKALRESEERLHFALEAGDGVGTWDWDVPGDVIYSNAPFATLFQVDPEVAAKGAPVALFFGHIHPGDQARVNAATRSAIEGGTNFAEEYRVIQPQGVRWVYARGRCHRDEANNPTRFPGVVFDITDRKLADERLRAIYDGTYEFIGLLTPDGTLLETNRASLEFAQSKREDVVGRKFWDAPWFAFSPGAAEVARDGVARAAKDEFIRYEASINSPAGDNATFDICLSPILNEQGEVILIVPEGRDITDLKKVEKELRHANHELTRVNRDLEEFAYVASHDLQEPLRIVNIFTQLLLKEFGGGEAKVTQYAASVHQGVARMNALLKDLLKFSHTMHSDEKPEGTTDLSASVTEALSVMKNRIEESGATITVTSLPTVRGDTAQLAHVFQNLISNALKYRQRDVPPLISISAGEQGSDWVISVVDNGIGFDPDHAERIFGLFKRLHRDEYEGTGLGLAICKRIVERYGGRIWAESTLGRGAAFHVALRKP